VAGRGSGTNADAAMNPAVHGRKEERMDKGMSTPSDEGAQEQVVNLFEFMQASPLAKAIAEDGIDFEIDRSVEPDRDIGLFDDDDPS
jgi:hypothetical protein